MIYSGFIAGYPLICWAHHSGITHVGLKTCGTKTPATRHAWLISQQRRQSMCSMRVITFYDHLLKLTTMTSCPTNRCIPYIATYTQYTSCIFERYCLLLTMAEEMVDGMAPDCTRDCNFPAYHAERAVGRLKSLRCVIK